jgi:hypothetical protein
MSPQQAIKTAVGFPVTRFNQPAADICTAMRADATPQFGATDHPSGRAYRTRHRGISLSQE